MEQARRWAWLVWSLVGVLAMTGIVVAVLLHRLDAGTASAGPDSADPGRANELAARFEAARARYLDRLRARYQRIDLEILIPLTEQGEHPAMLLGQVFVPQSVRADPPPIELPREVWRRLAEAGQVEVLDLPEQVDRERLEQARRAYQARPSRSVLDVLAEPGGVGWFFSATRVRVSAGVAGGSGDPSAAAA